MRLFEHPDFEQAILQAAEYFRERKLRPAIIEKDYYVTEALRLIATTSGDKIIFKGGTSLAKGWNLIQRFSEDIDIFLDPTAFQPALGKNAIDRELRKLRDSGREPSAIVELRSYLGQFLAEKEQSLGAEDERPFSLPLLHFRRTFVEKMFAIHGKVELLKRDKQALGSYARHYYDLFQLSGHSEVTTMLGSAEYAAIKADYDQISRAHFARSYFFPEGMSFAHSHALFPPAELAAVIGPEYEAQCRMLCYGPYPSWAEVQARFLDLRNIL